MTNIQIYYHGNLKTAMFPTRFFITELVIFQDFHQDFAKDVINEDGF